MHSELLGFNILGMNHGPTVLQFLTNLRYLEVLLLPMGYFSASRSCVVELSRQMSLSWDLVVEPSQLGSLKGLCGTRNTRVYTGSAPYGEGKSLRPVEVVLIRVSITRELNSYTWLSIRLLSPLNRCRVVPLYREADAQQPLESRPAHKSVRLGL